MLFHSSGWGLIYKRHHLVGFAYLCAEAGLLTAAFLSKDKAQDYRAKKNNPNYTFEEQDFYYDQETKFHRQNQIFLGLTVGVYALNFAHTLLIKPNTNEDVLAAADDGIRGRRTCIPFLAVNRNNIHIGVTVGF